MSDYSWVGPVVQGVVGGLGEGKASGLDAKQAALLQSIYDDLRNIPLPELEAIAAEQTGPSAMAGVYSDPEQRAQQQQVMEELRSIFEGGGFNVEDEAALNEALSRSNVAGNAQRKALASEFAQRGQLGAGARLAMGNMNAQGSANRANQSALNVAAMGQQRKNAALSKYADLAGDMRRQDFGEGSARAQASDAAERWNATARQRATEYNAGLPQQQFGNRVTRATGSQGAGSRLAGNFGNQAQATRNQFANYGQAAGLAAQGLASGLEDDEEG